MVYLLYGNQTRGDKMNKILISSIIALLIEEGTVYRFGKEIYGVESTIKEYIKKEGPVIITHWTRSPSDKKYNYWLKSYGLDSWLIESSLSPATLGLKVT